MKLNVRSPREPTHEGAPASRLSYEQMLRRSVMSCLLWESEFYESGQTIADRIVELVQQVPFATVRDIANEARNIHHLRHVPLLLVSAMAKRAHGVGFGEFVSQAILDVIRRPDELTELLAVHAKLNGVTPDKVKKTVSAPMKRGLAEAFRRFNEYSLAKYNRDGAIRLRDVLFLVHPKPKDATQADLWKRLANKQLKTPDTWEVALSGGADKKETFERLIRQGDLGYLALLRNLRNMVQAGCDERLVTDAIAARKGADRVLPFRYVAAARAAPSFELYIDGALCETVASSPMLKGRTVVLVDVSQSMEAKLSATSDMTRMDAAAALAGIVHAEQLRVFSFSNDLREVPPRRGMAGVDAVIRSQHHGGTRLGAAVLALNMLRPGYDRLIVITDEQSADRVPAPRGRGYMINVASAKNGVGYGEWMHIDGWSEGVLHWIVESEGEL